jgi:ABC-2 type transport system ATP-binding protein
VVEVDGLTRSYGDLLAVDEVSFEISKGEIVGLLGHNGAGKSTIMRMLTGYLEPTAGSIRIDGMEISEQRLNVQRKIGYLSENAPLYPDMSVAEYLEYVANLRSVPSGERFSTIRRALAQTKLMDRALDRIATLSKGYKQRLGVAQAILHRPEILILDEPTNGLDPTQILEMRSLVKELSAHATIILSTHILQEVEAVCERVIIMVQGHIGVDAKMSELQQSNRLLMGIRQTGGDVAAALEAVTGVRRVRTVPAGPHGELYLLDVDGAPETVAPRVAGKVVEQGWELYKMSEEERTLETVFREVNEDSSHAE